VNARLLNDRAEIEAIDATVFARFDLRETGWIA